MKVIEVEKPYSWLQWPVRLKNCPEPKLHITAKFFGQAAIDPNYVRLIAQNTRLSYEDVAGLTWSHELFAGLTHCLELHGVPSTMIAVHHAFGLIRSDFTPWRPHISVPTAYWEQVVANQWTPKSEELLIGDLELCLSQDFR